MSLSIDINQMILLLGRAVDLVGVDHLLHGRRVAILAVECGKQLGWDRRQLKTVFDAGLLHDAGVSSSRVHRSLMDAMTWSGAGRHCQRGWELFREFGPLAHLAPVIRYHHTPWSELAELPVDENTARISNLIYLADRVEVNAAPHYDDHTLLLEAEKISRKVNRYRGRLFAPDLVDAFLAAARAEAYWLILDPDFIPQYVTEIYRQEDRQPLGLVDLKRFARIVAAIVDAKSHFTTEHSLGVSRIARFVAEQHGITGDRLDLVEVAALLHDIGKLQIPDEVLESPHKLTPLERAMMKKHSFATFQILSSVKGFEELARWAALHHESLDGGGYPFRTPEKELPLEARIIKVADIYQALAQLRPYRAPLPAAQILSMLQSMAAASEVDQDLVAFVGANLPECQLAAVGGWSAPPAAHA